MIIISNNIIISHIFGGIFLTICLSAEEATIYFGFKRQYSGDICVINFKNNFLLFLGVECYTLQTINYE